MGMVGLVLLIACANLASLLVARGEAPGGGEVAVRLAFGARTRRLVRQLLTESLLIGVAGGAAGIALASWCLNAMMGAIPSDVGMTGLQGGLDLRVLSVRCGSDAADKYSFRAGAGDARDARESAKHAQGSRDRAFPRGARISECEDFDRRADRADGGASAGAGLLARTLVSLEHTDLGVAAPKIFCNLSVEPDLNGDSAAQTVALSDTPSAVCGATGVPLGERVVDADFADDDSWFNILRGRLRYASRRRHECGLQLYRPELFLHDGDSADCRKRIRRSRHGEKSKSNHHQRKAASSSDFSRSTMQFDCTSRKAREQGSSGYGNRRRGGG